MSDTRTRVRGFIVEHFLFGQGATLRDDSSFLEQGIIDSTGVLELIAFLEQTFSIKVSDHELVPDNLDSVDRVCVYLAGKTPKT